MGISIFEKAQVKKLLTPARRKILKIEVLLLISVCLLVMAAIFWHQDLLHWRQQIAIVVRSWLTNNVGPLLSPTLLVIREYCQVNLAPLLNQIRQFWLAKYAVTCGAILLAFVPLAFGAIAHAGGLLKQDLLEQSVLADELEKIWKKNRLPTLTLHAELSNFPLLLIRSFFILSCSFMLIYGFISGAIALVFNSDLFSCIWPGNTLNFDAGAITWLKACVKDAHYGLNLTSADFSSLRLFLSAFAAFMFAIPAAFSLECILGVGVAKLRITPTHINFPAEMAIGLNFKTKRLWVDVCNIELEAGALVFQFRTGGKATIPIDSMNKADLAVLLHAIEELCVECSVDKQITALAAADASQSMMALQSFTHIWSEGFARQFISTVFTPSEPGSYLQNQSLCIIRQLASSPWSSTFLARAHGKKLVVVKELLLPLADTQNSKVRDLFHRECDLFLTLSHPGIAALHDRFSENGRDYLVLDYKPGNDLEQVIQASGALTSNTICDIAIQICDVLSYLHERDMPIIHRDVSPDNIVVDTSGNARLIDFGAAKHLVQYATGTLIGKQSYIAPEQLRGQATPLSDLYSLGATMYTLLTGVRPVAIQQCLPADRSSGDTHELNRLVSDLTNLDPELRPQSASEVRARLLEIKRELNTPNSILLKFKKREHELA